MVGRSNFGTISKNRRTGGARRRNSIRMTSAISKLPRSLIGWLQRSILFRKTFSSPIPNRDQTWPMVFWTWNGGLRCYATSALGRHRKPRRNLSDPSLRIEPCDADSRSMPTARLWLPALELSCRCVSERCASRPAGGGPCCAQRQCWIRCGPPGIVEFLLGEIARWPAVL